MATINLRKYYPWYTRDEFIEVPNDVAVELVPYKQEESAHWRRMRRNNVYALDAGDGIERVACFSAPTSHDAMEYGSMVCRLCRALNSLPEKQGLRIEAHYILGQSITEIARADGVKKASVCESIRRGLHGMKIFMKKLP